MPFARVNFRKHALPNRHHITPTHNEWFLLAAGREPSGISGCFSNDDTGRLAPFRYKVDGIGHSARSLQRPTLTAAREGEVIVHASLIARVNF